MKIRGKQEKGLALILTLSLMSVIIIMVISSAVNLKIAEKASANYDFSVDAALAAKSGINYAIEVLKQDARRNMFTYQRNLPRITEQPSDADSGWTCDISIVDCNSLININNPDDDTLSGLLGGFRAVANYERLSDDHIAAISGRSKADGTSVYFSEEDIKNVADTTTDVEVGNAIYSRLRPYITAFGYVDPNVLDSNGNQVHASDARAPININDADDTVLASMLQPFVTAGWITNARDASKAIRDYRNGADGPFENVNELETFVRGNPGIFTDRTNFMNAVNPNRAKPATYTTDFSFIPGGIFRITARANVSDSNGNFMSRKEVTAVVNIYDIWTTTTKEQFRGEDADYDNVLDPGEDLNENGILDQGYWRRVTFMDSCPLNVVNDFPFYDEENVLEDSLKIGFWTNFDEDNSYDNAFLDITNGSIGQSTPKPFYPDPGDNNGENDNEAMTTATDLKIVSNRDAFSFQNLSFYAFNFYRRHPHPREVRWGCHMIIRSGEEDLAEREATMLWFSGMNDVPANLSDTSLAAMTGPALRWTPHKPDAPGGSTDHYWFWVDSKNYDVLDDPTTYTWYDSDSGKNSAVLVNHRDYDPITKPPHPPKSGYAYNWILYEFDPELRIYPSSPNPTGDENDPRDPDYNYFVRAVPERPDHDADRRIYHMIANESNIWGNAYGLNNRRFSTPQKRDATVRRGRFQLYNDSSKGDWDDIRAISDTGRYVSPIYDAGPGMPVEVGNIVWTSNTQSIQPPNLADRVRIEMSIGASDSRAIDPNERWLSDTTDHLSLMLTTTPADGLGFAINQPRRYVQFSVNMYSDWDDPLNRFEQTPVLEDVTITLIPVKSKILMWRES